MTDSRPRDRRSDRGRLITSRWVISATAVAGALLLMVAVTQQESASQPPLLTVGSVPADDARAGFADSPTAKAPTRSRASATKRPTVSSRGPATQPTVRATTRTKTSGPSILSASRPTRLRIPAIEVDTPVDTVGLTGGGEVAVPSGDKVDQAAWFDQSPTPGQYGASVIVGHIDSPQGPSVFYRLGGLKPGDTISVKRADQSTATFVVDGIKVYLDRESIPTQAVYGGPVDQSQLRLITCTNFDHTRGHYRGNAVVFAHLVSTGS